MVDFIQHLLAWPGYLLRASVSGQLLLIIVALVTTALIHSRLKRKKGHLEKSCFPADEPCESHLRA